MQAPKSCFRALSTCAAGSFPQDTTSTQRDGRDDRCRATDASKPASAMKCETLCSATAFFGAGDAPLAALLRTRALQVACKVFGRCCELPCLLVVSRQISLLGRPPALAACPRPPAEVLTGYDTEMATDISGGSPVTKDARLASLSCSPWPRGRQPGRLLAAACCSLLGSLLLVCHHTPHTPLAAAARAPRGPAAPGAAPRRPPQLASRFSSCCWAVNNPRRPHPSQHNTRPRRLAVARCCRTPQPRRSVRRRLFARCAPLLPPPAAAAAAPAPCACSPVRRVASYISSASMRLFFQEERK